MCLLKPSERTNNCVHEECKNFSMLNKSECLYSINQASKNNNLINPSNFIKQSSNQSGSLPQPQGISNLFMVQQSNGSKGGKSNSRDEDFDDEEPFMLNKKKVRVESNTQAVQENIQTSYANDFQTKNILYGSNVQQLSNNSNFGEPMMFNASGLNNILLNANQASNEQKQNNIQFLHVNQPMYVPFMQAQQGMNNLIDNQSMPYISYQPNMQPSYGNIAQTIKIRPNMNMNYEASNTSNSSSNDNSNRENNGANIEEFMKDVQGKLVDLLASQNKMLIDLREKNDLVQDTLACLINEVNALKQVVKQNKNDKPFVATLQTSLSQQIVENTRETANSESLLNFLYNQKQEFQYQLVFKSELSLPLYRERNFKFTILLTDKEGNLVKNTNRIPLTLAIYTSENPPKFVDVNTAGNKIFKGMIDKDLVDGAVTFDRIQIKEVTSHFRNGWVFFVVYPKTSGVVLNNFVVGPNGTMISHQQIKPLILEKVVVKAKRAKEREASEENEEKQNFEAEKEF